MGSPAQATRLSEAIEEHLASCKASRGSMPATLKSKQVSLDKLLLSTGNILMKNVGPEHIDLVFTSMQSAGLRASTINLHRTNLTMFFKWCQSRRYLTSTVSPMESTRKMKAVPREQLRVPAQKFEYLLDCAEHPRNRMIVAMALHTFLRASEIRKLRVQDVDLEGGFISVIVYKTKQRDLMPISLGLDRELRRWLTYYTEIMRQAPQKDWFLFPARNAPKFTGGRNGLERVLEPDAFKPEVYLKRLHFFAQDALEKAGYPMRDDDGASNQEGMHTLRRSGARARFDYLVDQKGYDGALREIQATMHHASQTQTERYLGLTLDVKKRNASIRGQDMFGTEGSPNVVVLQDRQVN